MGSLSMAEKAPGAALPESSCAYLLQELKVRRAFPTTTTKKKEYISVQFLLNSALVLR
jgi:hypothetical protein